MEQVIHHVVFMILRPLGHAPALCDLRQYYVQRPKALQLLQRPKQALIAVLCVAQQYAVQLPAYPYRGEVSEQLHVLPCRLKGCFINIKSQLRTKAHHAKDTHSVPCHGMLIHRPKHPFFDILKAAEGVGYFICKYIDIQCVDSKIPPFCILRQASGKGYISRPVPTAIVVAFAAKSSMLAYNVPHLQLYHAQLCACAAGEYALFRRKGHHTLRLHIRAEVIVVHRQAQ